MEKFVKLLPFLKWKEKITKENFKNDIIAGIVWAIIVLPQAVAFASIAWLPPEYWLYSAIVPAVIAAIFWSSWHLVSGPTTAISLVIFSALSHLAEPWSIDFVRLTITLSFMVWIIQFWMWLMKFWSLLSFISHTVVIWFTAWAWILIWANQIKNFFGISIAQWSSFYEIFHTLFLKFNEINYYVIAVWSLTLIVWIIFKIFFKKIPYMIPAILAWSLLWVYLNNKYWIDITHIKTVWALPSSLPPLSMPDFSLETIEKLIWPSLAITFLALTEAVAIAKTVWIKSWQRIDWNQEFIGQWLSNIFWSFFSAYPSSWSFNRSWVNFEAWARTPLASVFSAIALAIIVIFVAPYVAYLPVAVMAWILFLVAYWLIDFHHIKEIIKTSKWETILLFVTLLSTLFIELEFAVIIWVLMSIALYLNKIAKPIITRSIPNPELTKRKFVNWDNVPGCPQFEIIRIDWSIFFWDTEYVENKIKEIEEKNPERKYLLIRWSRIVSIDLSWVELLIRLKQERIKAWWDLYLSNLNENIIQHIKKYDSHWILNNENIFDSKMTALSKIIPLLNKEICKQCKQKRFDECPR